MVRCVGVDAHTNSRCLSEPINPPEPFANPVPTGERRYGSLSLLTAPALTLGAVGIYGVLAHFAARRRRDWAIRVALGLPGSRVITHVVGHGALLVASWNLIEPLERDRARQAPRRDLFLNCGSREGSAPVSVGDTTSRSMVACSSTVRLSSVRRRSQWCSTGWRRQAGRSNDRPRTRIVQLFDVATFLKSPALMMLIFVGSMCLRIAAFT
jgi:hypothetical protein